MNYFKLLATTLGLLSVAISSHAIDDAWQLNSTQAVWSNNGQTAGFDKEPLARALVDNGDTIGEFSVFEFKEPARFSNDETNASSYQATKFGFTGDSGLGVLHFAGKIADDEYQSNLGLSLGAATFSFATGRGDTYAKTERSFQDVNPYFFHGGSSLDYHYQGGNVSFSFGGQDKKTDATFGVAKVQALGVEDRHAYFAGVSNDKYYYRLTAYERGSESVGHGLDLGLNLGRFGVDYQELNSTQDAKLRRLGLQLLGQNNDAFRVDLETNSNSLYINGEDNRFMFRYNRLFGKKKQRFHAHESDTAEVEEETETQAKHRRFRNGAIVGGVVAGALIVSSGSDEKDRSNRFSNQNAAAFDVLNGINPTSVRDNVEFGGWVYRNADGTFASTNPVRGEVASVDPGPPNVVPAGTRATATYHTHGADDPRFISEEFSGQDLAFNRFFRVDGYLATPTGQFKKHIIASDRVVTLPQKIATQ